MSRAHRGAFVFLLQEGDNGDIRIYAFFSSFMIKRGKMGDRFLIEFTSLNL